MKRRFKIILLLVIVMIPINLFAYSKSVVDITKLSIEEIQDSIDKGYLTYELLTQLYLDRIDAYESEFNAIISINENAIKIAKEKDKEYQKNGRTNDLFGIPIILKDNIDYKGLATTGGTKALKDSVPYENSTVVQNLVDKGAIILGKSNMSEFAFSAANSYSSYGHVKNVYNIKYTPYGSSGGSAVSVSAYFASAALGTDTNSSIRLPSSAANIVGLRPTYGLIDASGVIKYDVTRDVVGPMTNNVEDNALLLTTMTNNDINYTKYLNDKGLEGKIIGVVTEFIEKQNSSVPILGAYYKDTESLINEAIKVMEDNGATIVYLKDVFTSSDDYTFDKTVYGTTMCYQFNNYIKGTSSKIKSFKDLLNDGRYVQALGGYYENCNTDLTSLSSYKRIESLKNEYKEKVYNIMDKDNIDVLIYPTLKSKTLALLESTYSYTKSASYTIAPMTGMPAITIPMGFDTEGFPYGLEIIAKENREDLLYEVSYSYQELTVNRALSKLTPPLYEVSETLEKLKNYYENDSYKEYMYKKTAYENYIQVYKEIENYLKNYNEMDESDAQDLLIKYEEFKNELESSIKFIFKPNRVKYVLISISVLVVLILMLKIKIKINKKRKKRKY